MMKKLPAIFIALFFLQCTYYHKIIKKEAHFFSPGEVVMLNETLKIIDFGYGYDPDVDLDFIFIYPQGMQDKQKKGKLLMTFLETYKKGDLISFYEKMYTLRALQSEKMLMYRKRGDWRNYTYIEKYLLPPLDEYMLFIEKGVIVKDKYYVDIMITRKTEINAAMKKVVAEEEKNQRKQKIRQASNGRKPR